MHKRAITTTLAALAMSGQATAAPIIDDGRYSWADYDLSLGAGILVQPKYVGSSDYEPLPLPLIDFKWKEHIFFNTFDGLGWNAYKTNNFRVGPILTYYIGASDREIARDVDPGIYAGAFAEFAFDHYRFDLTALKSIYRAGEGIRVEAGASYGVRLDRDWKMVTRASATFLDEEEMDGFFGLDEEQTRSLSNRPDIKAYAPGAGFQDVTLRTDITYDLTQQWKILTVLKAGYLLGEAADSPLVDIEGEEFQGYFGMGAIYHF